MVRWPRGAFVLRVLFVLEPVLTVLKAPLEEEAADSDPGATPLLADVAGGWLASFLGFAGGSFMVKSGSLSEMDVVGMADCDVMPPGVRRPGVTSPGRWLEMMDELSEDREDCLVMAGGCMLSKGLRSAAPLE